MDFTKKEILFASLVGSEVAKSIPRFSIVENELAKHPFPIMPFLNFDDNTVGYDEGVQRSYADNWKATQKLAEDQQFFPLSLKKEGDTVYYTLPYEPLITMSGSNTIVKRKVAKAKNFTGTVKEHYSQDDWDISITGFLFGAIERGNVENCFPREDFKRLRDYFKGATCQVFCEPLQLLGINEIVIEEITFPFTKGENVQAYEFRCLSDFTSELLLEIPS